MFEALLQQGFSEVQGDLDFTCCLFSGTALRAVTSYCTYMKEIQMEFSLRLPPSMAGSGQQIPKLFGQLSQRETSSLQINHKSFTSVWCCLLLSAISSELKSGNASLAKDSSEAHQGTSQPRCQTLIFFSEANWNPSITILSTCKCWLFI